MALRFLLNLGDKYAPVLRSSKFKEEGKLTPDEFVVAGEQLVHSCGTWSWYTSLLFGYFDNAREKGTESGRRDYLPADKQFLITRNATCRERAKIPSQSLEREIETDEGDNWTLTHAEMQATREEDIPDAVPKTVAPAPPVDDDDDDDDDVPDADEYLQQHVQEDPAELKPSSKPKTFRTYNISITYDNWYKTPRVWLSGFNEHGRPLTPDEMLEDISTEHAAKTATVENHPYLGDPQVSIHPCQHASVMKKFIDAYEASGKPIRVDQYMFLFVKFIAAVIPTIDYDFTLDMDSIKLDD